jgi:hypothetical protein
VKGRLLIQVLAVTCLTVCALGRERIDTYSPDRTLAIRVADEGLCTLLVPTDRLLGSVSAVDLIELPSRRVIVSLVDDSASVRDVYALWSPDGKRLAVYSGGHRGGVTTVFQMSGATFSRVELPEIHLPLERAYDVQHAKDRWGLDQPFRWRNSNELILRSKGEMLLYTESLVIRYEYEVRVHFDRNGKPNVGKINPIKIVKKRA